MSTEQAIQEEPKRADTAFETRDFYLAARKQAVIYARVSSKEQEKEGFSIADEC